MCVYTELLCKPRAPARSPIEVPWYPFWANCLAASFDRRSLVDANSYELPYATSQSTEMLQKQPNGRMVTQPPPVIGPSCRSTPSIQPNVRMLCWPGVEVTGKGR